MTENNDLPTHNIIDTTCPWCGAIARIVTDKRRVKLRCDNCGVSYFTTKTECKVGGESK